MRTYLQDGNVITVPAPVGGIASGAGYQVGRVFGVATTTADENEPVEIQLTGVFELPKAAGQTWEPGQLLYWDSAAQVVTNLGSYNLLIGAASATAESSAASGAVRLNSAAGEGQGMYFRVANDAALAALVPTLAPTDAGRLVLVDDRSGQGPQVLVNIGGVLRPLVGIPATITLSASSGPGVLVSMGAGASVNLAEILDATVRTEFPANTWEYRDYALTAPTSGIVRSTLKVDFTVSKKMIVTFMAQEYDDDTETWVDLQKILAPHVDIASDPYDLTGIAELSVAVGRDYRIVVRHDQLTTESITVHAALSITNFVFFT